MSENFLNRNRGCGDMMLYGCLVPAILLVAIIAVLAMATAAEGASIRLTAGGDPDPETGFPPHMTLILAFNPANDRVTSGFIQGQSPRAEWEVWTARQVTGTFDGTFIDVTGLGSFNGFQRLGKEVATVNVSADLSGRTSAFDLTYPDDTAFEHLAGYSASASGMNDMVWRINDVPEPSASCLVLMAAAITLAVRVPVRRRGSDVG